MMTLKSSLSNKNRFLKVKVEVEVEVVVEVEVEVEAATGARIKDVEQEDVEQEGVEQEGVEEGVGCAQAEAGAEARPKARPKVAEARPTRAEKIKEEEEKAEEVEVEEAEEEIVRTVLQKLRLTCSAARLNWLWNTYRTHRAMLKRIIVTYGLRSSVQTKRNAKPRTQGCTRQ